jgi:hypothetical protein
VFVHILHFFCEGLEDWRRHFRTATGHSGEIILPRLCRPNSAPFSLLQDQVRSETKKPPFACEAKEGGVPKLSPIPPAQDISGDPSCLGILASVSTYSPLLPERISPVVTSGFRQRLQLRGSVGLSPTSPKHVGCTSKLTKLFGRYYVNGPFKKSTVFFPGFRTLMLCWLLPTG